MELREEEIEKKSRVPGDVCATNPQHTQPTSCPTAGYSSQQKPSGARMQPGRDHVGKKQFQWPLSTCVKGVTLVPARLARATRLVGDSRCWASWLIIAFGDAPHTWGTCESSPRPGFFRFDHGTQEYLWNQSHHLSLPPGSSFTRPEALWKKNRVCPMPRAPRSAPEGEISSCLMHQVLRELVIAWHAGLCC